MKNRLALVVPANRYYADQDGGTSHFPCNLPPIIANLGPQIHVKVFDRLLLGDQEFKREITDFKPDIVGLTCQYPAFWDIFSTLELVHYVVPNATTILGGPAICRSPEFFLKYTNCDVAAVGDGAFVLNTLFDCLLNDHIPFPSPGVMQNCPQLNSVIRFLIDGETDVGDGEKRYTRKTPEIYSAFEMDRYPKDGFFPVIKDWGCPFSSPDHCQYCDSEYRRAQYDSSKKAYRHCSLETIMTQLEYLADNHGLTRFTFLDGSFCPTQEFTRYFREKGWQWQCQTRADVILRSNCEELFQCGCKSIWIGGDESIYDGRCAKSSSEMLHQAIKKCVAAGIQPVVCVLLGLTDQSPRELAQIRHFLQKLEREGLQIPVCINRYVPYPGTGEHKRAVELGRLKGTDDELYRMLVGLDKEYYCLPRTKLVANVSGCTDGQLADTILWLQDYNERVTPK